MPFSLLIHRNRSCIVFGKFGISDNWNFGSWNFGMFGKFGTSDMLSFDKFDKMCSFHSCQH